MGRRSVDIGEAATRRINEIHEQKPHLDKNAIINEALLAGLPIAYPPSGRRGKGAVKK